MVGILAFVEGFAEQYFMVLPCLVKTVSCIRFTLSITKNSFHYHFDMTKARNN